ncbi:MAG: hypothetical protein ABIM99_02550 [Candidatus Dojkabacteria bacterium]
MDNPSRRDILRLALLTPGLLLPNINMTQNLDQIKFPEWISNIENEKARAIISQYYANAVAMGSNPEEMSAELKDFETSGQLAPELLSEENIFQTGFITSNGVNTTSTIVDSERAAVTVSTDNPEIMLASSSKTFLVDGYLNLLKEKGVDVKNLRITVSYNGAADIEYRIAQFGGEKTFAEALPQFTNPETGSFITKEEFDALEDKSVGFEQLLYGILTLSTNNMLTNLKTFVMQETGLSEEALAAEIKRFAPNFQARATDSILEGLSNESRVEGYEEDKLAQVKRLISQSDLISTGILEHIQNNACNFGFDFGSTELGMKLKAEGNKIDEKTGSYQCVYWMPELAKQGFPPHAVFLTSVNIETPTGEIKSFVYYELVEVPFSPDYADAPGDMVQGWPDEETGTYVNFFLALANAIGPGFRTRMSQHVIESKLLS